jgi:hypothetical protein
LTMVRIAIYCDIAMLKLYLHSQISLVHGAG